MKRVALLGATGSIGRQAIEIVEAHPELELCAAASGSTPLDDVDAPLKQVGGDLTELLERAEPDVVLNAVVGFAGIHATLWALEHGVDLALANKESLVAAGELALAAQARGRRPDPAGRQRALRALPVPRGPSARAGRTRSSSPARAARSAAARATSSRTSRPTQALAHPTWRMGPKITIDSATLANKGLELIEAHFLFGMPYERIEVVHPADVDRAFARALPRRRGARASRLPGHARADLVRAHVSRARRDAGRAARPDVADARVRGAGSRDVPDARARARGGGEGRDRPGVVQRGERGRRRIVPRRAACRSSAIAEVVADALARADGAPARDLDDLLEADGGAALAEERLPVA